VAGGPPVGERRRRRRGGAGPRGGGVHEGRDKALEPVGGERREGDGGFATEPVSDAVLVLCRKHVRGCAEGAAGAAGVGGHGEEVEEGEGDAEEHA